MVSKTMPLLPLAVDEEKIGPPSLPVDEERMTGSLRGEERLPGDQLLYQDACMASTRQTRQTWGQPRQGFDTDWLNMVYWWGGS